MPGFTPWWDAVASLTIPAAEKAVLHALARHADWNSGARSFPKVETIMDETGLQERAVQYALRSLACSSPCGRARCRHLNLATIETPATRYTSTVYRVTVQLPQQAHFDEVAARRQNPYDAVVRRGYEAS
jgi:hypothetical protein